jgi:hypothetical protein
MDRETRILTMHDAGYDLDWITAQVSLDAAAVKAAISAWTRPGMYTIRGENRNRCWIFPGARGLTAATAELNRLAVANRGLACWSLIKH